MVKSSWDEVLSYYKEHFGLGEDVVELMADYDIIMLSSTGASNVTISKVLDVDLAVIPRVLSNLCEGFGGWSIQLSTNPYMIFQDCKEAVSNNESIENDLDAEFVGRMLVEHNMPPEIAEMALKVGRKCLEIENRINTAWF